MEVLQCYSKIVQNVLNFAPIWTTVLHENFGATDRFYLSFSYYNEGTLNKQMMQYLELLCANHFL